MLAPRQAGRSPHVQTEHLPGAVQDDDDNDGRHSPAGRSVKGTKSPGPARQRKELSVQTAPCTPTVSI